MLFFLKKFFFLLKIVMHLHYGKYRSAKWEHKTTHHQRVPAFTNKIHAFGLFPMHVYVLYFQTGM